MDMSKTAVRLAEFPEACLGVAGGFGLLAGDAGGCPGLDISTDGVPDVFLLQKFDTGVRLEG